MRSMIIFMMLNEKEYFILSSTMIIIGFVVLFFLFQGASNNNDLLTAKIAFSEPECSDGSRLGECSSQFVGNSCQLTRTGAELRFDDKCYE